MEEKPFDVPHCGERGLSKPISFSRQKKKRFLRSKEKEAIVVAKSAPLHFRLAAKIRCAPLLLLSQMDPLRWAPFGSPSPCAWSFKGDGCREGGNRGPVRSPAKRVRMGKEPQRSGREFPEGGREGCAACGDDAAARARFHQNCPHPVESHGAPPMRGPVFSGVFPQKQGPLWKKQRNEGARPCPTGKRWGRALVC